jgi:hypothetical protein
MKRSKPMLALLMSLVLLTILFTQAPAQRPGDPTAPVQQHAKDLTDIVNRLSTLADRTHTMSQMVSQQFQNDKGGQFGEQLRKLQEFDVTMGTVAENLKTGLQNYIVLREDPVLALNTAASQNLADMQNQLKTLAENLSSSIATLERLNKQLLGTRAK